MSGLSASELWALRLSDEEDPKLYVYDYKGKRVIVPVFGMIAWPIEFLLSFYHNKHVFEIHGSPSISHINRAVDRWHQKIRWRFYFDSQRDNVQRVDEFVFHDRPRHYKQCPYDPPAPANVMCHEICEGIRKRAIKALRYSPRNEAPFLIQWGFALLRDKKLAAIRCDKDGGFCVVPISHVRECKVQAIQNHAAYKLDPVSDDMLTEHCNSYYNLSWSISKLLTGDEDQRRVVFRSFMAHIRDNGPAGLVSRIDATIKSHKDAGKVVPRIIHASAAHPFKPLMTWIGQTLSADLKKYPHLIRDSSDLVMKLRSIRIPKSAVFLKIDIKDYFMSGKHTQLMELAGKCVAPRIRNEFESAVALVLTSQWVKVPRHDSTWKVLIGSGMGLKCSGEVSDGCFLQMAEIPFVLRREIRDRYSIHFYCRFKDDILCIMSGTPATRREFLGKFRSFSKFFELELEDLSNEGVPMLDVWVKRTDDSNKSAIATGLYVKPSSISKPLASTSMHPSYIHHHWPMSQRHRFQRLCSTQDEVELHTRSLVERLKFGDGSPIAIAALCCPTLPAKPSRTAKGSDSWLVLPYRFVWRNAGFSRFLYSIFDKYADILHARGLNVYRARLSWSLGTSHLQSKLTFGW